MGRQKKRYYKRKKYNPNPKKTSARWKQLNSRLKLNSRGETEQAPAENTPVQKEGEADKTNCDALAEGVIIIVVEDSEDESSVVDNPAASSTGTVNLEALSNDELFDRLLRSEPKTSAANEETLQSFSSSLQSNSTGHGQSLQRCVQSKGNILIRRKVDERPIPESEKGAMYTCAHCGAKLEGITCLKKHMATCNKERRYQCSVCSLSYYNKINLDQHVKLHADEKPFKCSVCAARFKLKAEFKAHKHTHIGGQFAVGLSFPDVTQNSAVKTYLRPFKCSICSAKFAQKTALDTHLLAHSENQPLKNPQSPAKSKQGSLLREYLENHSRKYELPPKIRRMNESWGQILPSISPAGNNNPSLLKIHKSSQRQTPVVISALKAEPPPETPKYRDMSVQVSPEALEAVKPSRETPKYRDLTVQVSPAGLPRVPQSLECPHCAGKFTVAVRLKTHP